MSTIKTVCPHCQGEHRIRLPQNNYKFMGLKRVRGSASGLEFELTMPEGEVLESGRLFTIAQEAGMALAIGGLSGLGLGLGLTIAWPELAPLIPICSCTGAALAMAMLLDELKLQRRKLIPWAAALGERLRPGPGRDDLMAARPVIETIARSEPGRQSATITIDDCPASNEQLKQWAVAALAGQSVAVGRWVGQGRPFSRSEYESLLMWLAQQRPKVANLERGRWHVTEAGRYWLRKYLRGLEAALPYH